VGKNRDLQKKETKRAKKESEKRMRLEQKRKIRRLARRENGKGKVQINIW